MKVYKGITFAEGYNKSFADFKNEFASTHVFKNIPSDQREAQLKEAYKIAIKGNGDSKTSPKSIESDTAK